MFYTCSNVYPKNKYTLYNISFKKCFIFKCNLFLYHIKCKNIKAKYVYIRYKNLNLINYLHFTVVIVNMHAN